MQTAKQTNSPRNTHLVAYAAAFCLLFGYAAIDIRSTI